MALEIRPYREEDLAGMIRVWNEVVEAGNAFPQIDPLTMETEARSSPHRPSPRLPIWTGASLVSTSCIRTTWAAARMWPTQATPWRRARGAWVSGRALVEDSLEQAARKGFRGLQFNAVVASNEGAVHLYEDMGFTRVGTIPGGFVNFMGAYEDMYIYYKNTLNAQRSC